MSPYITKKICVCAHPVIVPHNERKIKSFFLRICFVCYLESSLDRPEVWGGRGGELASGAVYGEGHMPVHTIVYDIIIVYYTMTIM